jgi:rubrerythrin
VISEPATRALGLALEAEKQSLAAYLRFARRTRDPGGKDMFIRLASDEYEHMRLLERLRAGLLETGQCPPADPHPSPIERLVPRLSDQDRRIRGTEGQNDIGALEQALEAETRARDFYREQAVESSAPLARTFERLAAMEQAHADLVQAELDSIQETGFWFGTREFTLESETG